jgi:hypothetical protein
MGRWRGLALGCALFGFLSFLCGAAAAATIKSQEPCVTLGGFCIFFDQDDPIPVVRSIRFDAPGPGVASVTLHGSMACSNLAEPGNDRVIDLASQIVKSADAPPDPNGPGGLRHALVLFSNTAGVTDSFNLASTRDFKIGKAGVQRYYFKIDRLRMDASTSCYVFNAAFSVLFVP